MVKERNMGIIHVFQRHSAEKKAVWSRAAVGGRGGG